MGCGSQGRGVAEAVVYYGEMVAICDVDDGQLAKTKQKSPMARAFKDFRKIMELKEVNIVVCGTVDRWHTLVSLAAMRARKDVYCEKPLTLAIDERKHLVAAEKKTGQILQTGTQQRSDPRFRLACEIACNEIIGDIKKIDVYLPAEQRLGPFKKSRCPRGLTRICNKSRQHTWITAKKGPTAFSDTGGSIPVTP